MKRHHSSTRIPPFQSEDWISLGCRFPATGSRFPNTGIKQMYCTVNRLRSSVRPYRVRCSVFGYFYCGLPYYSRSRVEVAHADVEISQWANHIKRNPIFSSLLDSIGASVTKPFPKQDSHSLKHDDRLNSESTEKAYHEEMVYPTQPSHKGLFC